MKKTFLVAYDYGMGGLWAYVRADSEQVLRETYPELQIFRKPPDWMTPDTRARLRTYDLDEEPCGILATVLDDRGRE